MQRIRYQFPTSLHTRWNESFVSNDTCNVWYNRTTV